MLGIRIADIHRLQAKYPRPTLSLPDNNPAHKHLLAYAVQQICTTNLQESLPGTSADIILKNRITPAEKESVTGHAPFFVFTLRLRAKLKSLSEKQIQHTYAFLPICRASFPLKKISVLSPFAIPNLVLVFMNGIAFPFISDIQISLFQFANPIRPIIFCYIDQRHIRRCFHELSSLKLITFNLAYLTSLIPFALKNTGAFRPSR